MNIINLSKKQYEKLEELSLPRDIMNTEGKILKLTYHRKNKVLKELYYQNGYIFANKLYTLEALDSNKSLLPKSFIIPDSLVSVHHSIIGFTTPMMPNINLATILKSKDLTYREQLYYLKKIGELLQELKTIRTYTNLKDIYINDLHEANFLCNPKTKEMHVIDLDSCKIGNNSAFAARYLTPFSLLNQAVGKYDIVNDNNQPGYIKPDENTDLYCYNIIILNFLRGKNINNATIEEFYNYLNYMDMIGISKDLLQVFNKLLASTENENPYLMLDEIEPAQIHKLRTKNLK